MQRVDLLDFSGGLSEQYAADGFTNRQWAKIKGFIIDSDYTIRSQWAGQSIGPASGTGSITNGALAVSGFTGSSNSYLVAISTDGYVWYATAPAETANYTVANAVTWTKLTSVAANTDYRFITEILLPVAGVGQVNALLIHSVSGTTDAIAIYEDDVASAIAYKAWSRFYPVDQPNLIDPLVGEVKSTTTAVSLTATTTLTGITAFTNTTTKWTYANDGAYPVQVRINVGGSVLATIAPLDSYTATTPLTAGQVVYAQAVGGSSAGRLGTVLGTYPLARRNVMPRCNTGVMWRNRLLLGDINTRRDSSLSWETSDNIQRTPYGFWYSELAPDSYYAQSILPAGSGESQILGMHVLDDYLITIASPATESDGIHLFKGTLNYLSLQAGTVTMTENVLRGGVGPFRDLTATGNRIASCVWPEAGIVVLLDKSGGVWYTDGIEIDRLDRVGPFSPDKTDAVDEVQANGKYLFVKRNGRYLVLNILSGIRGQNASAAWTELVLPTGLTAKSFANVGGSMYFVMNSKVYRFAMARNNAADTERATFDNVPVDLTVATPTLADPDQHKKISWFRFGMRVRARITSAVLKTAKVSAGPALEAAAFSYIKTFNRTLVERDEFVMPAGIGTSVEASGEAVFTGDIQLESATFWTTGGKMSRPGDGSDA